MFTTRKATTGIIIATGVLQKLQELTEGATEHSIHTVQCYAHTRLKRLRQESYHV